jgi:hypothetical protein
MPDVGLVGVDKGSEHGLLPVLGLWWRHAVEQLHLVLRTRAQEDPQYLGDVGVRDISLRNKYTDLTCSVGKTVSVPILR